MKILQQFAYIVAVYVLCEVFLLFVNLKIPGNVLGMLVMFALLNLKVIKLEQIAEVSSFLLTNMAFFFVAIGTSLIADYEVVKYAIGPILIISVVGTVSVFAVTGYVTRLTQMLIGKDAG